MRAGRRGCSRDVLGSGSRRQHGRGGGLLVWARLDGGGFRSCWYGPAFTGDGFSGVESGWFGEPGSPAACQMLARCSTAARRRDLGFWIWTSAGSWVRRLDIGEFRVRLCAVWARKTPLDGRDPHPGCADGRNANPGCANGRETNPLLRQWAGDEPSYARWTGSAPRLRRWTKREPWLRRVGSKTPASTECVGAGVACGGHAREWCASSMRAVCKLRTRGLQRAGTCWLQSIGAWPVCGRRASGAAQCGHTALKPCWHLAGTVLKPCQHGAARTSAADPRAPRARRFRRPSSRRTGCAGS